MIIIVTYYQTESDIIIVNFPPGQGSGAGCRLEGSGPESRGQLSRNVLGGYLPDGGSAGTEPGIRGWKRMATLVFVLLGIADDCGHLRTLCS